MSNLKEADFYYGAVLSTLFNRGIRPMLLEGGEDRQIYNCTTDQKSFRLFVKYRSKSSNAKTPGYSSWQFNFSSADIKELTQLMELDEHLCVGLVCGNDKLNTSEYAILRKEELKPVFERGKAAITISRKKGEKRFRLFIGGGRENALQFPSNRLY